MTAVVERAPTAGPPETPGGRPSAADPARPVRPDRSSDRAMSDRTWGAVLAVTLCAVVPAALVVATPLAADANPWLWCWALGITVATGLLFAVTVGAGRRRLYALTFAMFSYVWMGLAPLVQLRLNIAPFTTPNLDARLMLPALLVVLVGVLSWAAGNQAVRLVPSTGLWRRPREGRVSELRVYCFAFATLALATYYVYKSGIKLLFSNRETIFFTQLQIWSGDPATMVLITTVCTVPLIVPIAALRMVEADRRGQGKRVLGVRLLTGVLVAMLLLVVNPITSSRYIFGTVIFALVTLFGVVGSKRRFRLFAVAVIAAMVVLFPYADKFRYASGESLKQGGVVASLSSPDYDAFGQINNTVAYVDQLGTTHGKQALGVALWPVPRTLWPGKPTDTGILLADFRGYSFTNLSAPLWSELYINGGWLALALGMAGLGAYSRRADDKSLDWSRPLTPIGAILPFYMIILLRGSLLQATLTLSIVLAAAWYLRPRPAAP